VLQLQSVAAHLSEAEGLRPEAGYIKAAAVGLGTISGATVKALDRMPFVIRDSARPESGYRIVQELRQPEVAALRDWHPYRGHVGGRRGHHRLSGAEGGVLDSRRPAVVVP
jgi:hypothetical protein